MSYVWTPSSIVRSHALWTASATSVRPRCTSIITAPRNNPDGFARFWPALRGAEPWIASNIAICSPMFAEPANPTEPAICAATSDNTSPYRFGRTRTSNASGVSAIFAAPMSTIQCSLMMSGYSGAISSNTLWNNPSVIFMMLSLVKHVTFLRLFSRA